MHLPAVTETWKTNPQCFATKALRNMLTLGTPRKASEIFLHPFAFVVPHIAAAEQWLIGRQKRRQHAKMGAN
jgi:hypothetical protein